MPYKGFSLIELLIVVAIVGVLAAIVIPNYLNATIRANLAKTYVNLKTIRSAVDSYYIDYGWAPPYFEDNWKFGTSYQLLTTPVTYLNSIQVCMDTFQYKHSPNQSLFIAYGAPIEFNETTLLKNRKVSFDEAGISYIQVSVGPNLNYDSHLNFPLPYAAYYLTKKYSYYMDGFFVYHLSNGLQSKGDIIATNSQIYN